MSSLKRLLLIPAIAPFILILSISSLNVNQRSRLRILIWTTPEISLGHSIAIAGCLSFFIGTLPYILIALPGYKTQRRLKIPINNSNHPYSFESEVDDNVGQDLTSSAYIQRDVREPLPTIAVPYKVINKNIKSTKKVNSNNYYQSNQSVGTKSSNTFDTDENTTNTEHTNNDWESNTSDQW